MTLALTPLSSAYANPYTPHVRTQMVWCIGDWESVKPGSGRKCQYEQAQVPSAAALPRIGTTHNAQRRPTRAMARRPSTLPKGSRRTSSKTHRTSLAEERHQARSGKAGEIGSSLRVLDLGPSCRSRSRTRTRALDPSPTVTVVDIERPANPRGRRHHNGPSRPTPRSVPAPPGSGSATSCVGLP